MSSCLFRQTFEFRKMEMADFKELTEKRIQAMTTTTKCANDKLQADMNNLKTTLREKVTELQVNSSFNFKERDIVFENLLLNVEKTRPNTRRKMRLAGV